MEELDALVTKVTEKTGRESGKRFRVRETDQRGRQWIFMKDKILKVQECIASGIT